MEILSNPFLSQPVEYCPECGEKKDHDVKDFEFENGRRQRQLIVDQKIENAMIGPRFKDKTFENYEIKNEGQKKAVEDIKKFIKNYRKSNGLILIGTNGTGKNHLASATVKEIVSIYNKTALVTKAIKIVRKIKETWKKNNEETETEAIKFFVKPDLLVIDEVGRQVGSETEAMFLSEIIDDRYENLKQTIITGNVTIQELKKLIGERSVERFKEKQYQGETVIVCDWESYRGHHK
jgi:DNA replication protein DnaC